MLSSPGRCLQDLWQGTSGLALEKKMAKEWRWIPIVLSLVLSCGDGYFVTVDAHAKECFFDRASSGVKMALTFEVVEGGFLDIDVLVRVEGAQIRRRNLHASDRFLGPIIA